MTTSVVWPRVFRPKAMTWAEDAPDRGGTLTVDGNEQVVASPGGRWSLKMTFDVFGPPTNTIQLNRMLFWRAMTSRMQGRVGECLIGPYDWLTPAHLAGIAPLVFTGLSDGTLLSDGTGYQQSAVTGVLTSAANAQDQSITVSVDPGFGIQAGQYIGLGGNRLHRLSGVVDTGTTDATGREIFTCAIWPWLRAAYPVATEVEFEDPLCLMRFKTATTGALDLTAPWQASPTIELVEVF